MNIFPKRPEPAVDLDQLERDVTQPPPWSGAANVTPHGPKQYTPLQVIGHAITRLTWAEAEKMGEAVYAKLKDNSPGDGIRLTAAIQAWAEGWESFTDD